MGDAALPLTREQINEWSDNYAGVRVGKDCPMGPLFAQARAALDLADECERLRAENEDLREKIRCASNVASWIRHGESKHECDRCKLDDILRLPEPDRG